MSEHVARRVVPPIEAVFDDRRPVAAIEQGGGGSWKQRQTWRRRQEQDLVVAERVLRELDCPTARDYVRHLRDILSQFQSDETIDLSEPAWRGLYLPDSYADERDS